MLQALYEKVDAIPVTEFALDEEARKLFVDYYNRCQRLRLNHPKQGMRAMLGKAAEKVGRVATILHCIHASHLGIEVSPKIPAEQIAAAIKWVEYTTQQALSINIEVCSPGALESNLAKIISLAERNGGTVTARDVLRIFDSKYRPTSQAVQKWFGDLETMKYGEVTEKGGSIRFSLYETSAFSALAQNLDGASIPNAEDNLRTVSASSAFIAQKHKISEVNAEERGGNAKDNLRVLKPPVDKALNSNAENAEVFTPSIETSHSSMMSRTTKPTEFAEQIRKAIANFDRAIAVQVSRALKGKTELRKEVRAALTVDEFDNFRLLVISGSGNYL